MNELLLLPVPGGRSGSAAVLLRVVIAPRLDTGTLADAGLASWPPPQLADPWQVAFTPDGGTEAPPVTVTPRLRVQEGLWARFFGAATVGPAGGPPTDTVAVTSSSEQLAEVDDTYRTVTRSFTSDDAAGRAAYQQQAAAAVTATSWSDLGRPADVAPNAVTAPAGPRTVAPPTDVGRILDTLREHPAVLAALGLVVELDVPVASLPPGTGGVVRVGWDASAVTPALPPVTALPTAYRRAPFLPAPLTDDHLGGAVRLDRPDRWTLADVDPQVAVARLADAAGEADQAGAAAPVGGGAATPPVRAGGLPSLRTAGLLLVRPGRADDYARRRARSTANAGNRAAAAAPVLHAEDLMLGYRLDVARFGDAWFPLCARVATYRVDDVVIGTATTPEEGHVKVHAAVRQSDGSVHADEVVSRWDGWSLAVPRPDLGGTPAPLAASALPYRFVTDFDVPDGSLRTGLRFGEQYQLRARLADIAGGGLGFDDPDDPGFASAPFGYGRHEPIAAPDLLLPDGVTEDQLTPGVHVGVLVLRGEGGPTPSPALPPAPGDTQRTLARPVARLELAEQHGAVTGTPDATFPLLQRALAGALPDVAAKGVAAFVARGPGVADDELDADNWPAWPGAAPVGSVDTKAVTLVERPAAGGPVLRWRAGVLEVAVAPADDVEVELSSSAVPELVTHFAAQPLLPAAVAHTPATGRHPMINPPVVARALFAVRKPLAVPAGSLTATRDAGEAPAVLTPSDPLLGVEPRSTGQVDLSAAWTEHDDDVETPVAQVPVQSVTVHPGDRALGAALRHAFPDTRHRAVTYTVDAVSRFRPWFDGGADADFRTRATLPVVHVPSSARPAAPVVRSVLPAFTWTTDTGPQAVSRTRSGGRIRVELGRPWYSSGEDEQLALLLSFAAAPPLADWPLLTQLGRDPLWGGGTPARFPQPSSLPGGADVSSVTVPGLQELVSAVVATPWSAGGSWWADFDLSALRTGADAVLLRPAFARYQRHSLPGLEMSAAVAGDFVPLLPDRTLTVTRVGAQASVVLAGSAPASPAPPRVDVVLETAGTPGVELTDAGGAAVPGWRPLASQSIDLARPMTLAAPALLDLPLGLPPGALRVRVREVELVGGVTADGAGLGGVTELAERVVFTDTVVVPD